MIAMVWLGGLPILSQIYNVFFHAASFIYAILNKFMQLVLDAKSQLLYITVGCISKVGCDLRSF